MDSLFWKNRDPGGKPLRGIRRFLAFFRPVHHSETWVAFRETRIRQAWEASREFLSAAWGRNDLETLRLLCLNLGPDQILRVRLAERLKSAISAVLGPVTERLEALAKASADIGLRPADIQRLAESLRILEGELAGVVCRPGQPIPFDGLLVARAAGEAVAACDELRESMKPLLVSDLLRLVRSYLHGVHPEKIQRGDLLLNTTECPDPLFVAARTFDLAQSIGPLLERVLTANRLRGPVRLSLTSDDEYGHLVLNWSVVDRFHLDPSRLLEPLRVLAAYGARMVWNEDPENSAASLECWLPLVTWDAQSLDQGSEARA